MNPESFATLIRFFFFFFFFLRRGRFQKTPKTGNYWAASEKWHFAEGSIMAHIECWLGSFVIFRGSRPVLHGNSINL